MSLSNLGLDAFFEVYRQKTVIGAAGKLTITPTGVTQRIRALEKQLQTSLFIRTKKGMIPTEAGKKLMAYCKSKDYLEKSVLKDIMNESIENPIEVKFSASSFFMYSQVLPIVDGLADKYPSLFFSFNVDDNSNKIQQLKNNEADFVILPRKEVSLELDSRLLKKRKYVLVGNKDFKNQKKDYTIIDFSKYDTFTDSFFDKMKIPYDRNKKRHYINNTMMMPKLIESGIGVAVLDEAHLNDIKKTFKIYNIFPDKFYEIEWALAWLPRLEKPKYFSDIISEIL